MPALRRTLMLGLGLSLTSASLAEATEPTAEPVEEMVVVGEARPALDVLAGATTTRIETDLRLIEGAGIADLLAEVPGVQIRRFGGIGDPFEVSIRGSRPEQVPVFLDGVRLDTSLSGRSDLSALCLDVLQEIQVTRGAGAARAGTGAIGGVVNLVSRRPTAEPETRVRLAGGHFGSVEGSLRHARKVGDWDLALAYCGLHTEGDFKYQRARTLTQGVTTGDGATIRRENNEADRHNALVQVGRALGPGRLHLTHLFGHLERGTPGFDEDLRLRADERGVSALTSARFESPVFEAWNGRTSALLSHRFERNDFEDPDVASGREAVDAETEVHSVTAQGSLRLQFEALRAEHEVSILAEGRFDQRASNEANSRSRAGVSIRAELASQWWDGRLQISPSLRFERYQGLSEEWIPGLFLEARPTDWLTLKASGSRSYRIPSFEELYLPDKGFIRGNESLRPEEAWNFEVGAVWTSPFESPWLDAEIEFTWFAGEVDESIVFQLVSSNVVAPVNIGASQTRGYELTLRWNPHPWLRMTAARTVTQAKLESIRTNVAGIAVSQVDGRVEVGPRDRFKLVGEVHYSGRIPLNSGGTGEIGSRVVYDASASVDLAQVPVLSLDRFGRSFWFSVRGRNLGDVAIRDTRSFPQPGRNFSVAIEGVF